MLNRKGSKKNKNSLYYPDDEQPRSILDGTRNPTCFISERDIEEFNIVGEGFYSTVKVGEWTRPNKKKERVAIKCIKKDEVSGEILLEASNMVDLKHKNIIKLFGICLVSKRGIPSRVKLVTEYAQHGSLLSVIRDEDEDYHSFFCQITRLFHYAYHIAQGMQYLHLNDLIHFDLAARNVLLVTPNVVKICDFGLARDLVHDQSILLEREIAVAWCAPELIKNQRASKKCDVWSYGVLLWELLTFGEEPWGNLSPSQIIEQADCPSFRLAQPQACSKAFFELMNTCWSQNPDDRPQFTEIIDSFGKVKPVVTEARCNFWTTKRKELCFLKCSKITIIESDGEDKYWAQNEKAEIGLVDKKCLNFDLQPEGRKFETLKRKISAPSNPRPANYIPGRHDSKLLPNIPEENSSTEACHVEVPYLTARKDPEENQKPCSSQVQISKYIHTPAQNITGIVPGCPLQHLHYLKPRPLPRKAPNAVPFPESEKCQKNERLCPPLPKPRKTRPYSQTYPKNSERTEKPTPKPRKLRSNEETQPAKIAATPRIPRSYSTGDQSQLGSLSKSKDEWAATHYGKDVTPTASAPHFPKEDI